MRTIYKSLVEVKVLHEYYLTRSRDETIFDCPTQADKLLFLERNLAMDRPTIARDLLVEVPKCAQDLFAANSLHLIPTYHGFKILTEVEEVALDDGGTGYRPLRAMRPNDSILVGLRYQSDHLQSITNERINNPFQACYFFSNGATTGKNFPVLANPIASYSAVNVYEQGELTVQYDGSIQSYYVESNGDPRWTLVPGNGYVSEQDRTLLPYRFRYTFPKGSPATNAEFALTDENGHAIQTIRAANDKPLRDVLLTFDDPAITRYQSSNTPRSYRLSISAPGYNVVHNIKFIGALDDHRNYWGVVHLTSVSDNSTFNLLDDKGLLRIKRPRNGRDIAPEFFELRIKSRPTFWRYLNSQGRKLKENPALKDLLVYENERGYMTSVTMRNATDPPISLAPDGDARIIPLPAAFNAITVEPPGRLVTEIPIGRSSLFDVKPLTQTNL